MPAGYRSVLIILATFLRVEPALAAGALLADDFDGVVADAGRWHIPTWTSPTDGTFVGRTEFRTTQTSKLPALERGRLILPIESHNPKQPSFLASELISNAEFSPGIDIAIRAKMRAPLRPGIVGGLFLYALAPGSKTLHDEIDFELLSNVPVKAQTNLYGNEPLGTGHVELIPYRTGAMTDFHIYEIHWTAQRVTWLIDGKPVRTTTENIPAGPMRLYFNIWAPDPNWPQAYSPDIQPAHTAAENGVLGGLIVDSVIIRQRAH